jgi:hypothetical protein
VGLFSQFLIQDRPAAPQIDWSAQGPARIASNCAFSFNRFLQNETQFFPGTFKDLKLGAAEKGGGPGVRLRKAPKQKRRDVDLW